MLVEKIKETTTTEVGTRASIFLNLTLPVVSSYLRTYLKLFVLKPWRAEPSLHLHIYILHCCSQFNK